MVNSSGAGGGAGKGDADIEGGGSRGVDNAGGGPSTAPTSPAHLELGCGPVGLLSLHVTTTTGRNFTVIVDSEKLVIHLKKVISKNLKVSKERICLLYRERVLHDGTLRENGLVDGSKIVLIPNVETGLLVNKRTQRADNTVMQALETLNDKQVNAFLSGRSPLNLSMRLGDHMMLIQLQLSTLNASGAQASSNGTGGLCFTADGRIEPPIQTKQEKAPPQSSHSPNHQQQNPPSTAARTATSETNNKPALGIAIAGRPEMPAAGDPERGGAQSAESPAKQTLGSSATNDMLGHASTAKQNNDQSTGNNNHTNRNNSNDGDQGGPSKGPPKKENVPTSETQQQQHDDEKNIEEQDDHKENVKNKQVSNETREDSAFIATAPAGVSSPIKSLSKLVSARMVNSNEKQDSVVAQGVVNDDRETATGGNKSASASGASMLQCSDPITANLTSCLCRRLDDGGGSDEGSKSANRTDTTGSESSGSSGSDSLHRPALNPTAAHKIENISNKTTPPTDGGDVVRTDGQAKTAGVSMGAVSAPAGEQRSLPASGSAQQLNLPPIPPGMARLRLDSGVINPNKLTYISDPPYAPRTSRTVALAEVSRNLTQTLRKLSKRVFTENPVAAQKSPSPPAGSSSASTVPAETSSAASSSKPAAATVSAPSASNNTLSVASTSQAASSAVRSVASSGAVIESMKHHGKGIYSGTFSGTLNPTLQDKFGRPKRDIGTIIHILNDLLSAAPQCATGPVGTEKLAMEAASDARVDGASPAAPVAVPVGSKRSFEESKEISESGSATPPKKCSTSVVTREKASTVAASGSMSNTNSIAEDVPCTGCKPAGGSTSKDNSASANVYRSMFLSSVDGSKSSTQLVFFTPSDSDVNHLPLCKCGGPLLEDINNQPQCKLCIMKALEMENLKTKQKLDSLRLIMKQKRERREARKVQSSPYHGTSEKASSRTDASDTKRSSDTTDGTPLVAGSGSISTVASEEKSCGANNNQLAEQRTSQQPQPEQAPLTKPAGEQVQHSSEQEQLSSRGSATGGVTPLSDTAGAVGGTIDRAVSAPTKDKPSFGSEDASEQNDTSSHAAEEADTL